MVATMRSSMAGLRTNTKRQGCLLEQDGASPATAASSLIRASLTSTGANERSDRRCFTTSANSMVSSWSSEITQVAATRALGAAVAGVLAFHTKLDVGHDLEALADGVAALRAQTEIFGRLVKPLERGLDTSQGGRAFAVALGRNHLVHLGERLRLIFPTHGGRVCARRLDGHVTFTHDLRTQLQQALA